MAKPKLLRRPSAARAALAAGLGKRAVLTGTGQLERPTVRRAGYPRQAVEVEGSAGMSACVSGGDEGVRFAPFVCSLSAPPLAIGNFCQWQGFPFYGVEASIIRVRARARVTRNLIKDN